MNRWLFLWRRLSRELWWRASLYAAFSVVAALAASLLQPFVPEKMAERLGGESVEQVLAILSSSMLAVATFSLGAMVTAYTSVSSSATPRAAALITADESTQRSLATFVGAFLYGVVGITAINAGYYGPQGRAVLFVLSLLVVGLVAFRLLAWVSRLTSLARLGSTVERVESETCRALKIDAETPCLGGTEGRLDTGVAINAAQTGYVQNIDVDRLQALAERLDGRIEITARPGAFVMRGEPLARIAATTVTDKDAGAVDHAFSIVAARSFDQDPRYGLIVLGEISAKALLAAINDVGTAVQVIGTGVRLLEQWADAAAGAQREPRRPRLLTYALEPDELLDDIYGPTLRHGAGDLTVALRLRKALRSLAAGAPALSRAATAMEARLMAAAERTMEDPDDLERLRAG